MDLFFLAVFLFFLSLYSFFQHAKRMRKRRLAIQEHMTDRGVWRWWEGG